MLLGLKMIYILNVHITHHDQAPIYNSSSGNQLIKDRPQVPQFKTVNQKEKIQDRIHISQRKLFFRKEIELLMVNKMGEKVTVATDKKCTHLLSVTFVRMQKC